MSQPEFDRYSASYEELLKDSIRDRFIGGGAGFFHLRKRDLIRQHFSYFPEPLYRRGGRRLEHLLRGLPLGGQYAVFGTKKSSNS